MADSSSINIQEPFGAIVGSGNKLTITPPHGMLSRRDYVFDSNRQSVSVADKKFFIMGSQKTHLFEHLYFRMSAFGKAAERCVEMQCRMPGRPLIVYQLTDITPDEDKLATVKKAITDATGIDRWE